MSPAFDTVFDLSKIRPLKVKLMGFFPLPSVPYPLAAAKGSAAAVQVTGQSVELQSPLAVTMPPQVPGDRLIVGVSARLALSPTTLVAGTDYFIAALQGGLPVLCRCDSVDVA